MDIMKKLLISLGVILGLCLDQLVKFLTVKNIPLGESRTFIKGVISFTYLRNYGAAWSMLQNQHWFFLLITLIAITVILYYMIKSYKNNKAMMLGALALILTGTLGNFIDRIRLSYVVDMIQFDFINFPIFNIADMFLTFGVIYLYVAIYKDEKGEK